jgi:hypothetical protein
MMGNPNQGVIDAQCAANNRQRKYEEEINELQHELADLKRRVALLEKHIEIRKP